MLLGAHVPTTGGVPNAPANGRAIAATAIQVVARVKLFLPATSLGGTESLIEHRRSSEGPTSHTPDDLVADLRQALG